MRKMLFVMAACAACAAVSSYADQFVPENGSLDFTSSVNQDNTIIVAAAGSTINIPAGSGNVVFYPHLVVSGGVVRVVCAEGSTYLRCRFVSGIRAVEGGALEIDGVNEISVDRKTLPSPTSIMPPTGPLCDIADVRFTDPSPKGLVLDYKSTVRTLPTNCVVRVVDNATVALACANGDDAASILAYGELCLTNFNAISLTRTSLPDGCTVRVSPGRTLAFKSGSLSDDGLSWTRGSDRTGRYNVILCGSGSCVHFCNPGGFNSRNSCNISGYGEVLFKPESGNTSSTTRFCGFAYTATASKPISILIDTVRNPAPPETWRSKVSHWFDASDADSVVPFTFDPNAAFGWTGAVNRYDGHQLVIGLKDKVEGSTISLYNTRIWNKFPTYSDMKGDYVIQVLPYLVEGGLNGKNYLGFGTYNSTEQNAKYDKNGNLVSVNGNRRLRFWDSTDISGSTKSSGTYTKFRAEYAIMVFGSQQGGGRAVVGTDGGTVESNGYLIRNNGTDKPWTPRKGYSMHVDGLQVDPGKDYPNGGWQIVSIDMTATNTVVTGIGARDDSDSECGGQNYAEVLFFSEKPTPAERAACEQYLANKWGLVCTHWDVPFANISGTGTVELEDDANRSNDSVEEVEALGSYSGTVLIPAGQTLLLSRPLPPTESVVPEANRVGWFDPDFAGATTFDGNYGHDDLLNILYGRNADSLLDGANNYMFSSGVRSGKTEKYNFAPRVVQGVRGALTTGPRRKWIVFKEAYGDNVGNMIRRRKVGDGVTGAMNAVSIRQAFFVTDTTDGGGTLFSDTSVFATSKIKPRNGNDVNDPIWSPSNTVAMTSTWLDTVAVDGTRSGYSGRPEVLSFTTESNYALGYIANWIGEGSQSTLNAEIVGEFIFYSQPLDDAARTKVQEYLMYKWFGDLNGKYSDYSSATVKGEGTVKSATLRNLPQFDSSFTGTLVGGSALSFTLDSSVNSSAAVDAITLDQALTLENGAVITLNLGARLAAGNYTLLTAPAVSGAATFEQVGNPRSAHLMKLHVDTDSIWLEVIASGTTIMVR